MKHALFLIFFLIGAGHLTAALTHESLLESLRDELTAHYALDGEWQVDLVRELTIPAGADAVLTEGFPSRPASNMVLRVQFLAAGKRVNETNLSVRAQLWRNALVAGEPLKRGQGVESGQLHVQRLDMLRESQAVTADEALGGDFIYARSIPAGRILNWRYLQRRPIVQRGQIIEVAAVDGGLSVVLKAMALENGAHGDFIRVRNLQTQREIAAVVVGEGRTEIHF